MATTWNPGVCTSTKLGWKGGCSVLGARSSFKQSVAVPRFPAGAKDALGRSTRLPQIQIDAVAFKGQRAVTIPLKEGSRPAVDYLRQLERVVSVAFPDSARISYLGNSTWRSRLRPVSFFSISATPVCDVQVFNKGDTLQIRSDRLLLDLSGIPSEYINQSVRFRLRGHLEVAANVGTSYKKGRAVEFIGFVALGLSTNLPLPLALIPEPLVTPVGDAILDAILGAMESALLKGITADYHAWCQLDHQQQKAVESSSAVVGAIGSP